MNQLNVSELLEESGTGKDLFTFFPSFTMLEEESSIQLVPEQLNISLNFLLRKAGEPRVSWGE